jgi:hypothetical protein
MATTLEGMITKGKAKYAKKAPLMKSHYDAAKPSMKEEYDRLPFGPKTKEAYRAGIDAAIYPDMTGKEEKWAASWRRGVSI